MLKAENLICRWPDVVCEWSFELQPGDLMAVVGRSGVGKSTLLQTLLGFQKPEAGQLAWQQSSLLDLPVSKRPFGVLFQNDNLFEHLSVKTNMALGLNPAARLNEQHQALLEQAAERFQVADQLNKRAEALSGGQKQRVALARVFLQNKPVLLLDEPFSSLDPALRLEGIRWVKELQEQQGTTVILVTHHLDEIIADVDSVFQGVSSREWNQYPAGSFSN